MSWLSGWNNRIVLTINGDHINSTLSDFPLAIKLSSSTGITNEDVTCVFDELNYDVNDDFNGTNGDSPDSALWTIAIGSPSITSNKLDVSVDSTKTMSKIASNYKLDGDFDIQIDFFTPSFPSIDSWALDLIVSGADGTNYKIRPEYTGSKHEYHAFRDGTQGYLLDGKVITTDSSGKLRITRTGDVFKGYYWNGSSWVQVGSGLIINDMGNCICSIKGECFDSYPTVTLYADNFVVNSGTVVWPQKTFPNRKKIAVTNSDGISQLYTELHYWDQTNKYAVLWTKVPTLNAGVNKRLFLYYDANHSDNTTYVGDTGECAAQNVWKSSYKAVYHMSEDPSGGSACIKDSTSNANHLTPYGSMTSTNSVDSGLLAKAIDFDGSDDYLLLPSSKASAMMDAIDSANAISVSLWVKQDNTSGHEFFVYGVAGDPENNMEMKISSNVDVFYEYDSGSNYSAISPDIYNPTDLHQIYITLDSSKSKIYLDGNLIKESNAASSFWSKNSTRDFIIGAYDSTPSSNYMDGVIFEYHISGSVHSADWIKAAYEAESNNLITFSTHLWYITGYVDIEGTMASGVKLYLYERESGTLVGETTSNGDGYFIIETAISGEHFIVALDKDDPPLYNDIIKGRIVPHMLI